MAHRLPGNQWPYPYRDILAEAEAADINKPPSTVPAKLGGCAIDSKANTPAATNGCSPNRPPNSKNPAEEEEDPAQRNQSGKLARCGVAQTPNPLPMYAPPRH